MKKMGRPRKGKQTRISRTVRVEPRNENKLLKKLKVKKIQAAFDKMLEKELA